MSYEGHRWLYSPVWDFGSETATQALRLIGSGPFDEFPSLQVVLGHLGERIPFDMWRIDNLVEKLPVNYPAKKRVSDYMGENFHLTTSGQFRDAPFHCALAEMVRRGLCSPSTTPTRRWRLPPHGRQHGASDAAGSASGGPMRSSCSSSTSTETFDRHVFPGRYRTMGWCCFVIRRCLGPNEPTTAVVCKSQSQEPLRILSFTLHSYMRLSDSAESRGQQDRRFHCLQQKGCRAFICSI